MTDISKFEDFCARVCIFIERNARGGDVGGKTEFNALALELFHLQFAHNQPYRRLCESRQIASDAIRNWREIPVVPAAGFKELELTILPPQQRSYVFHSSGTTAQSRGRHFHNHDSLAVYEASLTAWFRQHFPVGPNRSFLSLTPPPDLAPNSSLVHMFETIRREFGAADALFTGGAQPDGTWSVDIAETISFFRDSIAAKLPVTLFGTAFNYVHLLDELAKHNLRFELPAGSCVLETGGYKGRSRVVAKLELHAQLEQRLGVPANYIVSEYGMSELSSQAYDWKAGLSDPTNPERTTFLPLPKGPHSAERSSLEGELTCGGLGKPLGRGEGKGDSSEPTVSDQRIFRFPPWARAQIINPETGSEVADGETGLIRIFDLANVYSVMAVQTEDLGVRRGAGFELLGRAALAETRGCSLMSI
jgi:hypothetical protein